MNLLDINNELLIPWIFRTTEETTSCTQVLSTDASPKLSPAGAMDSTLLQLRTHVATEKLEMKILKQVVQRLQRHVALLQPEIELFDQSTTSKSPSLIGTINHLQVQFAT